MSVKTFSVADWRDHNDDKLVSELSELHPPYAPWSMVLHALRGMQLTWLTAMVKCTLSYDKDQNVFALELENLVA